MREDSQRPGQVIPVAAEEDLGQDFELKRLHVITEENSEIGLGGYNIPGEGVVHHPVERPSAQLFPELLERDRRVRLEQDSRHLAPPTGPVIDIRERHVIIVHLTDGIVDKVGRCLEVGDPPSQPSPHRSEEEEEGDGSLPGDGVGDAGFRRVGRREVLNGDESLLIKR